MLYSSVVILKSYGEIVGYTIYGSQKKKKNNDNALLIR